MAKLPWYKTAHRWNQCNLTAPDARDCDVGLWRKYWRENGIQGTIVNAWGTVSYYPSEDPLQSRSTFNPDRDLFKEFMDAARGEGLAVIARTDVGLGTEALYKERPEWFFRHKDQSPEIAWGDKYTTCINSGYFTERIPAIMTEIITKYHPDGLADNSWAGARDASMICYCQNCKERFAKYSGGLALPDKKDFSDRTFLLWLKWNLECRANMYKRYNELAQELGGEDCVWMGMVMADFYASNAPGTVFSRPYDHPAIRHLNKALVLDSQGRHGGLFDQNSLNGMAMHELFGEDTLLIESVCSYNGTAMLRRGAMPYEESRSWMRAGISAGISPMPHIIGSAQEDTRMFDMPKPVMDWQRDNEAYLFNRVNAANVGVVWNMSNQSFYGSRVGADEVRQPLWGTIAALKRRRIGYFPVHSSQIREKADRIKLLILPNVATLGDAELGDIIAYIKGGGSVIYSGKTASLDDIGVARETNPLDALFGITEADAADIIVDRIENSPIVRRRIHNYMRPAEPRHPIFKGFERTGFVGVSSDYRQVRSNKLSSVACMIPAFPVLPPEWSYMDEDKKSSNIPAILAGDTGFGGRAVYFAAELDKTFAETTLPDLGDVLSNAILWALGAERPFTVEGPGELECKLYSQNGGGRLVLSLLNYSGINVRGVFVEEYYAVGPQAVTVRTNGKRFGKVTLRCAGTELPFTEKDGVMSFTVDKITDQELVVIE